MKTSLIFIHQCIALVTAGIFISTFTSVSIKMFPQLFILGTILVLITLSISTPRALYKKNLLRFSLLLSFILLITSIVGRIIEITNGILCISCISLTILYLIICIIEIILLKQLYQLVQKLFN